jgi:hypothetical protein
MLFSRFKISAKVLKIDRQLASVWLDYCKNSLKSENSTGFRVPVRARLLPFLTFVWQSMRDLIWTIILIWLAYRIVGAFRNISQKKQETLRNNEPESGKREKQDYEKALNKEGDYVDFEDLG